MAMREDIEALIESLVETAQIPGRRRRDELRRELRSHFEDSGATPEAVHGAIARFGSVAAIGDSFRKVYRLDYLLFYLVKVVACLAGATLAAIAIEAIASLRIAGGPDAWRLSPAFSHAAGFGVILTVALVAAAEATRSPVTWLRAVVSLGGYGLVAAGALSVDANIGDAFIVASLMALIGVGAARAATPWMSRASLTLASFAVAEYVWHQSLGVTLGPLRAVAAGAILVMLWASTITIVAFSDRAFGRAFRTT
jgi:hypothetical protein